MRFENDDYPGHSGFRAVVAQAAQKIGDPRVVHLDGRKMLTTPAGLWFDLVHPNADGMFEIGSRLAERIEAIRANA